jgi:hypothetical protein
MCSEHVALIGCAHLSVLGACHSHVGAHGQMALDKAVHHVHHPCGAFIAEGILTT